MILPETAFSSALQAEWFVTDQGNSSQNKAHGKIPVVKKRTGVKTPGKKPVAKKLTGVKAHGQLAVGILGTCPPMD